MLEKPHIAIIGLGYVGLPLALEFSKHFAVTGYDIDKERVQKLGKGIDDTNEAEPELLESQVHGGASGVKGLRFVTELQEIAACNCYIVTVPTPINEFKSPDLQPLRIATRSLASVLKKGDFVIYESTVYPGCTEEVCVPILEECSGLKFNEDFFVGYSPERINPGDRVRTLTKIKKVTSGSTPEAAQAVDKLYRTIIDAGTHLAPSLKIAEASKAIENAQRDVNISFVNELSLIFDRIGIDTGDVLAAAATKWNFLTYKPGLVGGHCIGVDPYYLAHKAESLGYHPQVILSGRRVNDQMGMFVANKVIKLMLAKGLAIKGSRALVLGITFKENCPDTRNTKVTDVIRELEGFGVKVDCFDPNASKEKVAHEYGIGLVDSCELSDYQAIIMAVSHTEFLGLPFGSLNRDKVVVYDTKSVLDRSLVDARL
jgi:UDP-N-acetyl-D-galactosamine dehydrogenase